VLAFIWTIYIADAHNSGAIDELNLEPLGNTRIEIFSFTRYAKYNLFRIYCTRVRGKKHATKNIERNFLLHNRKKTTKFCLQNVQFYSWYFKKWVYFPKTIICRTSSENIEIFFLIELFCIGFFSVLLLLLCDSETVATYLATEPVS